MRRRPNLLLANEGGLDLVAIAGGARLVKSNAKISFVTRAGVTVDKADLLKSGQIDPATPIEPIRGRIVASGAAVRSVDFFSEVNPDVLGSFWASTRDWTTKHKTEVAAFRASILDGIAFIDAHPNEARAIEQKDKDMGFVDPTAMATFATKLDPKDFAFVAKLGIELGVMKQPIDASKLTIE
jgi:NitT/TauT family transport system substrate-binding protein